MKLLTEIARHTGEQGAYASVIPVEESANKIDSLLLSALRKLGMGEYVSSMNDLHVTVMHSKTSPDPSSLPYLQPQANIQALLGRLDVWPGHDNDGYIVGRLYSPALSALNKFWKDLGCVSDFPTYEPHITLASNFFKDGGKLSTRVELFLKDCNRHLRSMPLRITLTGHRVEDVS